MPHTWRPALPAVCVVSLVCGAFACNFLVDNKFSTYDRNKDSGCSFAGRDTTCGACMKQNCSAYIDTICLPPGDGGTSTVLQQLEACASDGGYTGDARASSTCSFTPAANVSDIEQRAYTCVHDKCIVPAEGRCLYCKVGGKTQDGTPIDLHSNACGTCLLDKCATQINSCCDTQIVAQSIASCGDPTSSACQSLIAGTTTDGGKKDGGESSECVSSILTCAKTCASECD